MDLANRKWPWISGTFPKPGRKSDKNPCKNKPNLFATFLSPFTPVFLRIQPSQFLHRLPHLSLALGAQFSSLGLLLSAAGQLRAPWPGRWAPLAALATLVYQRPKWLWIPPNMVNPESPAECNETWSFCATHHSPSCCTVLQPIAPWCSGHWNSVGKPAGPIK